MPPHMSGERDSGGFSRPPPQPQLSQHAGGMDSYGRPEDVRDRRGLVPPEQRFGHEPSQRAAYDKEPSRYDREREPTSRFGDRNRDGGSDRFASRGERGGRGGGRGGGSFRGGRGGFGGGGGGGGPRFPGCVVSTDQSNVPPHMVRVLSTTLWVGGVQDSSAEEMRHIFEPFGTIENIHVRLTRCRADVACVRLLASWTTNEVNCTCKCAGGDGGRGDICTAAREEMYIHSHARA